MEFGVLSRLTGDPIYESYARRAVKRLWEYRSNITGLLGKIGLKAVFFTVELSLRELPVVKSTRVMYHNNQFLDQIIDLPVMPCIKNLSYIA